METRRIGTDGPEVSVIGLGCNNFGMRLDAARTKEVVDAALAAGITHFDTAEMYGGGHSEEYLGAALGARRDEVVIATKVQPRPADETYRPGLLAERIREGCETSLRRLGTDRIDLYYQHVPDPDAPIEEVLDALAELQAAGKVLHLACSNYDAAQLDRAGELGRNGAHFCASQSEWSLVRRRIEQDVVPAAIRAGMGVVPYFPLASGMLTGKYQRGVAPPEGSRLASSRGAGALSDRAFDRVEAMARVATDRGHTLLELAIGWLAAQPGVPSVIAGATTVEQVQANVAAAEWQLSEEDLAAVADAATPQA